MLAVCLALEIDEAVAGRTDRDWMAPKEQTILLEAPSRLEGLDSGRSDPGSPGQEAAKSIANAADMRIATREELRAILNGTSSTGAMDRDGLTPDIATLLGRQYEWGGTHAELGSGAGDAAESMLDCYLFIPKAGVRQSLRANGIISPSDGSRWGNATQFDMPIRCITAMLR